MKLTTGVSITYILQIMLHYDVPQLNYTYANTDGSSIRYFYDLLVKRCIKCTDDAFHLSCKMYCILQIYVVFCPIFLYHNASLELTESLYVGGGDT